MLPTYDVCLLPIETILYGLFTENVTERSKPTVVGTLALRHVISFSSTIGVTYHTTGRILSKVYKPILFYNPALTCTATDSLSVTIKHCIVRKTVHKCVCQLQPIQKTNCAQATLNILFQKSIWYVLQIQLRDSSSLWCLFPQ